MVIAWLLFSLAGRFQTSAHGLISFGNYLSRNAVCLSVPFYDAKGRLLEGGDYFARLYAGDSPTRIRPVGTSATFTTADDPFRGSGFIDTSSTVQTVPVLGRDYPEGAWMQIRVWEAKGGTSFDSAASSGAWTGVSGFLYVARLGDPNCDPPCVAPAMCGLSYPGLPLVVFPVEPKTVRENTATQLRLVASGTIAMTQQWYEGVSGATNRPVNGATNLTYQTPPLSHSTRYWCRLTTTVGSTDSDTIDIQVYPATTSFFRLETEPLSGRRVFTVDVPAALNGRLEFTTDLLNGPWSTLRDIPPSTAPFELVDPAATNSPERYYRVVSR